MRKPHLFIALIIFILLFNLAVGVAYAQPNQLQSAQPQFKRITILDFKKELSLTEDQEKEIKAIIEDFQRKERILTERIVSLDKEIRQMLEKSEDIESISKKIKEAFSLRAELVISDIKAGRKIDSLLTLEQLKKWREIRDSMAKKGTK